MNRKKQSTCSLTPARAQALRTLPDVLFQANLRAERLALQVIAKARRTSGDVAAS